MTTQKIQFFLSDLEHILKIGEIKEMHVAEQNGRTVLRIECEEAKADEYKTIRVQNSQRGYGKQKPSVTRKPAPKPDTSAKPATFAEKALAAGKDFFLNPERNRNKPFGGN